ncbi:cellulase family glycosylhydrolase [Butyrivibrio sp. MC2013]|uniref:cellulase family glycosylhydrolase n=1 Tax=Butyrivibrio sp. MC2013 TaxID=1280686 RepID=UPI000427421A|nr:cellulase family glycosylhydrolase [Butyrivibrio sp. MC2013]
MKANAAITSSSFLKANGKNLRNNYGNGDIVNLRGTNAGGYLVQEFWMTPTNSSSGVSCEMDIYNKLTSRFGESRMRELIKTYQDNYWTTKDFDNCKNLGINCIRLPFWYMNFVDFNGNYINGCFDRLDWFIDQAGQRGIYVILDFHGAPGSQNGSDHSGVDGGDNKQGASQFFFGNNAYNNQQLYYDIWYKIAQRYKGNPTVAGYDLLNEPFCTYRYNSSYSADQLHSMLWDIYNNAYNVIRSADPDHVIIMESVWDAIDLPNPSKYGWTNVMYEYHNYLYDDYDNAAGKQITNMQNKINGINNANYNVPSYMGEFCYFNNLNAWSQGLALLNNSGLSWTNWTYKVTGSNNNWGLYNQNVTKVNVSTDSFDTIKSRWSNVGTSSINSGLANTMKPYLAGTVSGSSGSGSSSGSTGGSSSSLPAAGIADGEYYIQATASGNIVCADNTGASPLAAIRSGYGGAWESIFIVNNSDGTVSFKSGANNKYVCAVIDEQNQLLARSASIGTWERYKLEKINDNEFAIKAVANDKYVCADQDNGNTLYANRDSVSGWESFKIYAVGSSAAVNTGSSSGSSSSGNASNSSTILSDGEYYFKDSQGLVVCAENTGADPLVANKNSCGGAWETLVIVNNADGTISLKSRANDKYVCAVIDEQNQLLARSDSIGTWEKYNLEKISDGSYALKAVANGKYVCADQNKSSVLYADRDSAGGWETFSIYKIN